MAELFDEGDDVPGDGAILGGVQADNRVVPAQRLSPGGAPEQEVGLVGAGIGEVVPAARVPKKVKPLLEPLEPEFNKVLSGNPGAPTDLTDTQKQVADYRLLHPEATQAEIAQKAGVAVTSIGKMLARPQVKLYMSAVLNEQGATLQKAARVISQAQEATKKTYVSFEGKIRDEREDPDHDIRLKAAKASMEAHGALEDKGMQVNVFQSLTDEQLMQIRSGKARPDDFMGTAE